MFIPTSPRPMALGLLVLSLATACAKDDSSASPPGSGGAMQGGAQGGASGSGGAGGSPPGRGGAGGGSSGGSSGAGGGSSVGGGGGAGTSGQGGSAGPDAARPADAVAAADVPRAADGSAPARGVGPAGNTCPANVTGDPLPQNRAATMIRGGFAFVEGPVWIAAQKAFYFSDFSGTGTNGRIHKYVPETGKIEVFVPNVGTNGLAVDEKGQILAASHDMQRLTRIDPATGMRSQVAGSAMYMNAPFNSVNDVVVRSDGNIYFTDPDYQRGGRMGQDMTAYYRLSPAGALTRIGTVAQPNGISLSPDGNALYVASSQGGGIRKYAVAADGTPMGRAMFSPMGSDGMAVDCAGNVYLTTGGRVVVLSPAGQSVGEITVPGGGTTNAAFGGDDGKTLFITAGRAVFQIKLNLPGLPN